MHLNLTRRILFSAVLLFATCGLVTIAANSARADLRDLPNSIQMRCGPADPAVQVTLSAALNDVVKCEVSADGVSHLTQTASFTVNIGANRYDAKVMDEAEQTCADLDLVHIALNDGYSAYILNVGKTQSSIGDGHAAVCQSH